MWNPALYDLIPTDQLEIRGTYVDERETKDGLGAPLVAKRIGDQVHDYAPTPHFYYCATGLARFEGSRCVLGIEDPLEKETTRLGQHNFPLAADYTSPLAMMLVEMHPKELELPRLLHPAKFAATARIARLEPYDPDKTVVLVIHGLMASPATWFPLINHLRADEDPPQLPVLVLQLPDRIPVSVFRRHPPARTGRGGEALSDKQEDGRHRPQHGRMRQPAARYRQRTANLG